MLKYHEDFDVLEFPSVPKWNSKDPHIPIIPRDAVPKNKWHNPVPGRMLDYDGRLDRNGFGMYEFVRTGPTFEAVLLIEDFEGGRSAANIVFKDAYRDQRYLMPASPALEVIKKAMAVGDIIGDFKMVKRGANYRLEVA